MPDIKLYRNDRSCSMVPHIVLRELDIPFTTVRMRSNSDVGGYDAIDESLSRSEYVKLNADAYVPTLVVDGKPLTENLAILFYLSELSPQRHLFGSTSWERAKVAQWLAWLTGAMHGRGFGCVWRPQRFSDDESVWPDIQVKGRKFIGECYERIESRIAAGEGCAVGDGLSVVDIYLHTMWRWSRAIGIPVEELKSKYPSWAKLMRNVEKLKSVRDAMAEENDTLTFEDSGAAVL
ncbi:hypothetical protein LTR56_017637 [Elasticomyces elasticus]|nr:hypothetical protein LTR56_017637 [Elasticomyces elasticus]KAK3638587.1 hypothetical protein LTR22_017771 [Elasticomyces elasticus]KAK4913033.1 hypothetical protein LTR49_018591 [Elasticomyces elasticus]KAK5757593.1 hypothetical protein LTS12_012299 [Elasticomyces elasticus]